MRHAKDQHVIVVDTIDDDVFADRKTSRSHAEIIITGAAKVWMAGEEKESAGDGVDQMISDVDTPAFLSDVIPDIL
jgi:hypothetical protein